MTKTFVVLNITEYESIVIYAGEDSIQARSYNLDTDISRLKLEVWSNGEVIQKYKKTDIYEWILEFDKKEELENKIEDLEYEIKKAKLELSKLE